MTIGPIIEIILYVSDMARMTTFYRDTLGFPILYPPDQPDLADQFWVTLDTGACTLALHAGGERRHGEDRPKMVFAVRDIHAARATLVARGLPLGEVRAAAPGVWVCDGEDPEGNRLSIESHDN